MLNEKEQLLEMIRALPEDSTIDDIIDELYFRMQVDLGIKELNEGKGIPHDQVKSRISKWLVK
jgi:hypothetical protein